MSDYISRDAAIAYIREQSKEMGKAFEEQGGESGIYADAYNDLAEDFYRFPAADVEPVRHGRWERCFEDWRQQIEGDKCSACGFEYYGTGISRQREAGKDGRCANPDCHARGAWCPAEDYPGLCKFASDGA